MEEGRNDLKRAVVRLFELIKEKPRRNYYLSPRLLSYIGSGANSQPQFFKPFIKERDQLNRIIDNSGSQEINLRKRTTWKKTLRSQPRQIIHSVPASPNASRIQPDETNTSSINGHSKLVPPSTKKFTTFMPPSKTPGVGEYEVKFPDKKPYAAFIPQSNITQKPGYAAEYRENVSLEATRAYIKMHSRHHSPPSIGKRIGRGKSQDPGISRKEKVGILPPVPQVEKVKKGMKNKFLNKIKEEFDLINSHKEVMFKLNTEVKNHMNNFRNLISHPT